MAKSQLKKVAVRHLRSKRFVTLLLCRTSISYRGRTISSEDIGFLRQLIIEHPQLSRCALSRLVCEAWEWKQANGVLRDMVCRGLMLVLARAGHIELPPVRRKVRNHLVERPRPEAVVLDNTPVHGSLRELGTIEFQQVRHTPEEALFNSLVEQYHYLGYEQPVGEHLKYLVYSKGQAIACFAWCSAARHLAGRDGFVGWNAETRKRNLHLLAYNTRFLILPWVEVPHLASHLLGRMAKLVPHDWQKIYAHPVYWLETFIDPARFGWNLLCRGQLDPVGTHGDRPRP